MTAGHVNTHRIAKLSAFSAFSAFSAVKNGKTKPQRTQGAQRKDNSEIAPSQPQPLIFTHPR
jgi:hypothetical protein